MISTIVILSIVSLSLFTAFLCGAGKGVGDRASLGVDMPKPFLQFFDEFRFKLQGLEV